MSAIGLGALQAALFARLTGDATLMGLVTGVYDGVPEGTAPPYVTLGEGTEVEWNTFDRRGHEATVTLHVYSEAAGFKEALEITERVTELATSTPLVVAGHGTVLVQLDDVQTIIGADGRTRHIPITLRVLTQDSAA